MKRPTFFLSSTIYDFRDLRSALKFYLEEQGCKVLASEFNDFDKQLDTHSYEACVRAIKSADYFVLFVGCRVGGWYDEVNRISITQREYREAYSLQASGTIKLVNFVRSDVWQLRETRRELAKHLECLPLEAAQRKAVLSHSSKFADDAEFLCGFIEEVARNQETKLAVQSKGTAPRGNWIHVFANFKDIIDVLHGQILSSLPMKDIASRRLLRHELRDYVSQCVIKVKGGERVLSPRGIIDRYHKENPYTVNPNAAGCAKILVKDWKIFPIFAIHLACCKFNPVVLTQVLSDATFLEFDPEVNGFRETLVHEALLQLQQEIRRFTIANTSDNISIAWANRPEVQAGYPDHVQVDSVKLGFLLSLLDRWYNILELSTSVLRHLDGLPFMMPKLRPETPVHGMQSELDEEKPTEQDVDLFISEWKI